MGCVGAAGEQRPATQTNALTWGKTLMDLDAHIRRVPDFPKPGILFYDISTLLAHPRARATAYVRMSELAARYAPEYIVGIESRGFIVGMALAERLGCGFVMLRKRGKLPGDTIVHSYDLEYGSDSIEIVNGLVPSGARCVIADDLMATGGTAAAAVSLLSKVDALPLAAVGLIELEGLGARDRIKVPLHAILRYPA